MRATPFAVLFPFILGVPGPVLAQDGVPSGLSGRIELDGLPASALRVGVVPSRQPSERPSRFFPLGPDGEFELTGLAPGSVNLEVHAIGREPPLVILEGLELRAGDNTDARLLPIRLPDGLVAVSLAFEDHLGDTVDHALICVREAKRRDGLHYGREAGFGSTSDRAWFVTDRLPMDFVVAPKGFAPLQLRAVRGERVVKLRRAQAVEPRLDAASAARLGGEFVVVVMFVPTKGEKTPWDVVVLGLDGIERRQRLRRVSLSVIRSTGAAPARLDRSGRYRLNGWLRHLPSNAVRELRTLTPEIRVKNANTVQTFDVSLDEAELTAALRELGK